MRSFVRDHAQRTCCVAFVRSAALAALTMIGVTAQAQAWTVSLSTNRFSPQPAGTQITLTATASGAWATPTYRFLVSTNNGGTWTTLRDWSASNQFVWTPTEARSNWLLVAQADIVDCSDPNDCYEEGATSPRVNFSTDVAVTGVSLTANRPSGQPLGTTVTWTATVSGGYAPNSFKWQQSADGGATWTTLQNWTSNASQYVWTPAQVGTLYLIRVAARSAASASVDGEATTTASFLITGPPLSGVTFTTDKTLPQPAGTPVTWTANVTGGIRPYLFWWNVKAGGGWTSYDITGSNQFTYTAPTPNADYQIDLYVWSADRSPDDDLADTKVTVTFSTRTTVSSVTVVPNRSDPQPLGTAITWTATPLGGTAPISYKWMLSTDAGASYVTAQDWTTNASQFVWRPAQASTLYRVAAAARSAGSSSTQGEATGSRGFTIAGPPVSTVTLTANKTSPQSPNTAITWTAIARGGTAPLYYYWSWTDGNGHWFYSGWSTNAQLVWTPTYVSPSWQVFVSVVSATADFEALDLGSASAEASTSATFSTATTVLSVRLVADRPSGQTLGTTINWTASPSGGTSPLSYKWLVSLDDGITWSTLQDWTPNANRYGWTPTVATSLYQVRVLVRSAGSTNGNGECDSAQRFVIANGTITSLTLTASKASPQVTGTPITLTATPSGGTAPYYYEWSISSTNGGAWGVLRDVSTSNQLVWTPQEPGSGYRLVVNAWSYDADEAEASASINYIVTPRVSGLTLTANRRSPQAVNTVIGWTAAATGGTAPISYRWKLSSDAGATWTVVRDWTSTATQWSWTPNATGAKYLVMVSARSTGNTDAEGEATTYASFVVTNSSGALVADTFNGSNGTLLRNRIPEVAPAGVKWTITGSGDPTIQAKQAKASTVTGYQLAAVDPGLPDAIVATDVVVGSGVAWGGLALRLVDINNFLVVRFNKTLSLTQVQAGQSSELASSTPAVAINTTHRLEARLQDDRIRVYWDGVFQFQASTSFQQGATRHGLAWNPSTSTTTVFDNFDLRPATIVITGPDERTDFEETNVTAQISAADSQGAALTYSATGLPPELTVNSTTGAISGYLTAAAAGMRTVTLRVTAGTRFAERTMQWLVMCPAQDYVVSPYTLNLPSGSGAAYFWVITPAECPWQAVSQNAFIAVDSRLQYGTKELQIAWPNNNPGAMPAVGSVKVAGRTVIVTKAGTERGECRVFFAPERLDFNADGGSGTVTFSTADPCEVLIAAEAPWIHVSGRTDGVGAGSVTVAVDRNFNTAPRTGYIAIAGTVIVVDQSANMCTFDVEHDYFDVSADPESHDVQVYAPGGCGWDAWSNTTWLRITEWYPSSNPAGSGHIRFSVENNPGVDPRIGTLSVAGKTVTVFQHGIATAPQEDVQYYHLDAIGSVRMVTNASGAVVSRHDYLPFGTEWSPPATKEPLRFTGKERDSESTYLGWGALDYSGARYYQPATARMISPDPSTAYEIRLVDPQRWNKYAYAVNNPIAFADPDGRDVIFVSFPDGAAGAGHMGIVAVDPFTGEALYGGFNPIGTSPVAMGTATTVVGTIRFDSNGNPERQSVDGLVRQAVLAERQGPRAEWAYFKTSGAKTALLHDFIVRESRRLSWYHVWGSRGTFTRNCLGFCLNAGRVAGLDLPKVESIPDMLPNRYFNAYVLPMAVMSSRALKPVVRTCYGEVNASVCDAAN